MIAVHEAAALLAHVLILRLARVPPPVLDPAVLQIWRKNIMELDAAHHALRTPKDDVASEFTSSVILQEVSYGRGTGISFTVLKQHQAALVAAVGAFRWLPMIQHVAAGFVVLQRRLETLAQVPGGEKRSCKAWWSAMARLWGNFGCPKRPRSSRCRLRRR